MKSCAAWLSVHSNDSNEEAWAKETSTKTNMAARSWNFSRFFVHFDAFAIIQGLKTAKTVQRAGNFVMFNLAMTRNIFSLPSTRATSVLSNKLKILHLPGKRLAFYCTSCLFW